MHVDNMRDYVEQAYPGPKWRAKVASMSDKQIMAIYFRMVSEPSKRGKHSERRKEHAYT